VVLQGLEIELMVDGQHHFMLSIAALMATSSDW